LGHKRVRRGRKRETERRESDFLGASSPDPFRWIAFLFAARAFASTEDRLPFGNVVRPRTIRTVCVSLSAEEFYLHGFRATSSHSLMVTCSHEINCTSSLAVACPYKNRAGRPFWCPYRNVEVFMRITVQGT